MKKKGFTLIELIAVLVIMAILALIVTPLVMNIIRKARVSADKRSIDAYGRSIELAVASYLLDTGKFPTDISQLTIEYSGSEVVCETTQLNPDSSVYLVGCTVAGRTVDYEYGKDKSPSYTSYSVGDEVTYNGVDYYVIKNSGVKDSTVTLLKAEPLTVSEVNTYGGVGTENNHVNVYSTSDTSASYYQTASNQNGYGGMAYYSSETCGLINNESVITGCTMDYADSDIKYVVDAWKAVESPLATEARLITFDELKDNLGYEQRDDGYGLSWVPTQATPNFVNINISGYFRYCTMSQYRDSSYMVWSVGRLFSQNFPLLGVEVYYPNMVRPVIVLPKTAISS